MEAIRELVAKRGGKTVDSPQPQKHSPPPAAPAQKHVEVTARPMMMETQPPMPYGFQGKGPRVGGQALSAKRGQEPRVGYDHSLIKKLVTQHDGCTEYQAGQALLHQGGNFDAASCQVVRELADLKATPEEPKKCRKGHCPNYGNATNGWLCNECHKELQATKKNATMATRHTHIDASMARWNCTRKVSPGLGNCLFATHEAGTKMGYGDASGRWAREQVVSWVKTHPEECRDRIPGNLSNAEWVAKYEKDGEYADEFSAWVLSRVFHQNIHVMQVRDDAPDFFYTNSLLNPTVRMIYEPETRNQITGNFVGGHYDLAEQQWRDVWDHDLFVLIARGVPKEYARNALMNTNGDMAAAVAALDNLMTLIEMGFNAEQSKNALQDSNDDVKTAIEMMM